MKTQKYVTIANSLRNKILSGDFPAKSQLPYERDLIETYGASKMTVKKATDLLVDEGLIVKIKAKGTFVNNFSKIALDRLREVNYFRGSTALYADDKLTSRVLVFDVIAADERVQIKLNLKSEEKVYHIKRVRSKANQPFVIEEMWMPVDLIVHLKKVHAEHSIYEYIEQQLGYIIKESHRSIAVRTANADEADLLQVEVGHPVVLTTQTARFLTGQVFEYSHSTHIGENFKMEVILNRHN